MEVASCALRRKPTAGAAQEAASFSCATCRRTSTWGSSRLPAPQVVQAATHRTSLFRARRVPMQMGTAIGTPSSSVSRALSGARHQPGDMTFGARRKPAAAIKGPGPAKQIAPVAPAPTAPPPSCASDGRRTTGVGHVDAAKLPPIAVRIHVSASAGGRRWAEATAGPLHSARERTLREGANDRFLLSPAATDRDAQRFQPRLLWSCTTRRDETPPCSHWSAIPFSDGSALSAAVRAHR